MVEARREYGFQDQGSSNGSSCPVTLSEDTLPSHCHIRPHLEGEGTKVGVCQRSLLDFHRKLKGLCTRLNSDNSVFFLYSLAAFWVLVRATGLGNGFRFQLGNGTGMGASSLPTAQLPTRILICPLPINQSDPAKKFHRICGQDSDSLFGRP